MGSGGRLQKRSGTEWGDRVSLVELREKAGELDRVDRTRSVYRTGPWTLRDGAPVAGPGAWAASGVKNSAFR